jgi:hypothetical protein
LGDSAEDSCCSCAMRREAVRKYGSTAAPVIRSAISLCRNVSQLCANAMWGGIVVAGNFAFPFPELPPLPVVVVASRPDGPLRIPGVGVVD